LTVSEEQHDQPEPEEVIAEGSGPHAAVEVDGEVEGDVELEAIEAATPEAEDGAPTDDPPVEDVPAEDAPVEAAASEGSAGEATAQAELPTSAAGLDDGDLKFLVEALVFAADKPVTLTRLRQLTRVADVKRLERALEALATDYASRGLVLQQVSGGYQFRTQTRYATWVQQLIAGRPVRLSRAQLETLAIIAYRQPITRPEIDDIRGVDSSATLKLLLDRALIRTLGHKEEVGRPMLYGTTREFLDFFSLGDLRELPTLREYSELTAESRRVVLDELGPEADASGAGPAMVDAVVAEAVAAAEAAPDAALEPPADAS
jgi:segregation and condensation protein B